jgi:hypothetical protein
MDDTAASAAHGRMPVIPTNSARQRAISPVFGFADEDAACLRTTSSPDRILDDLAITIKTSQKSFPVRFLALLTLGLFVFVSHYCIFHTRKIGDAASILA